TLQCFNHGPGEVSLLLLGVFISALSHCGGVQSDIRLHFTILDIKVKSLYISLSQRIRSVGTSPGIVATGIEKDNDLSDSCGANAVVHAADANRGFLQERYVIAQLRVGWHQIRLTSTFDPMAGE